MDRRGFLRLTGTAAAGAVLAGGPLAVLQRSLAEAAPGPGRSRRGRLDPRELRAPDNGGYGPLVDTGGGLLLPAGFSSVMLSPVGSALTPSGTVPRYHDGMAAFAHPTQPGWIRLIRNHEVRNTSGTSFVLDSPYDPGAGGGTTTLDFDPSTRTAQATYASLSGTFGNCAGGPTPWGSWLSCEETTLGAGGNNASHPHLLQDHGFVFEVPVGATSPSQASGPIPELGRFNHEAVAVDPGTGVVYLTEDKNESGIYRFVPTVKPEKFGDLAANGGQLQMLKIAGRDNYDTRKGQRPGQRLPVEWVDISDPSPNAGGDAGSLVYQQGKARGGAIFARGEGAWAGYGEIHLVSTSGGDADIGQVWTYVPRTATTGELILLIEAPGPLADGSYVLKNPDNCCLSPGGSVVLCEDRGGGDHVRAVTPGGLLIDLARPAVDSELAGATFSPDGAWLFVNLQNRHETYAITGPWSAGPV